MHISAETRISETLGSSPGVFLVYRKYNLRCPTCACRETDKVGDVAWNYGVKLDAFLRDLNAAVGK
jgi:hypothetical protein